MQVIFSRDQIFTVYEVLDGVEEGEEFDDVAGIAMAPPEGRMKSDQGSGDEELNSGSVNRLTGFYLRAQAHLLQKNRNSDIDNSDDKAQTQMAQAQTQSSTSKKRKTLQHMCFAENHTAYQNYYQFFFLLII